MMSSGALSVSQPGAVPDRLHRRGDAPQRHRRFDVHRIDPERREHQPRCCSRAFSATYHGQVFALFIIADAAAEAAIGLGIMIAFFRNRETVLADEMDLLKW